MYKMKTLTCVCLELDSMEDALFYYPVMHFVPVGMYCFPRFCIDKCVITELYPVLNYNKGQTTKNVFFFLVLIDSKYSV